MTCISDWVGKKLLSRCAELAPLCSQRFEDDRFDDAGNVILANVVRSQLPAFFWIEAAFEQRAENGGFNFCPVFLSCAVNHLEFLCREGQGRRVIEQAAVEVIHVREEHFPAGAHSLE